MSVVVVVVASRGLETIGFEIELSRNTCNGQFPLSYRNDWSQRIESIDMFLWWSSSNWSCTESNQVDRETRCEQRSFDAFSSEIFSHIENAGRGCTQDRSSLVLASPFLLSNENKRRWALEKWSIWYSLTSIVDIYHNRNYSTLRNVWIWNVKAWFICERRVSYLHRQFSRENDDDGMHSSTMRSTSIECDLRQAGRWHNPITDGGQRRLIVRYLNHWSSCQQRNEASASLELVYTDVWQIDRQVAREREHHVRRGTRLEPTVGRRVR